MAEAERLLKVRQSSGNYHAITIFYPMEFLPKKGKEVLVFSSEGGLKRTKAAKFDGDYFIGFDGFRITDVTGWANLPGHPDHMTWG